MIPHIVALKARDSVVPAYLVRGPIRFHEFKLKVSAHAPWRYELVVDIDRYSCGGIEITKRVVATPVLCPASKDAQMLANGIGLVHEGWWAIPMSGIEFILPKECAIAIHAWGEELNVTGVAWS